MRGAGCVVGGAIFAAGVIAGLLLTALDWLAILPSPATSTVGALVLLVACAIPVVVLLRRADGDVSAMQRVLAHAPRFEAEIIEIRFTLGDFRIVAEGRHPVTGEMVRFLSPMLRRAPLDAADRAPTIPIAIDPTDPARGVMDLAGYDDGPPVDWARVISS